MGTIKKCNDILWSVIFRFFYPITDNVYLVIIFVSLFSALIIFGISYILRVKWKIPLAGFLSILLVCSIGYMTQRLPMVHNRMQIALSTTAGIIESSSEYKNAFEEKSGIQAADSPAIASYLYHMTDTEKEQWNVRPEQLYSSLFSTFDQIRSGYFMPDVNLPCFGAKNSVFIMVCIFLLMTGLTIPHENKKLLLFHIVTFSLQCGFLLWTTTISSGAAIGTMSIWLMEETLHNLVIFFQKKSK